MLKRLAIIIFLSAFFPGVSNADDVTELFNIDSPNAGWVIFGEGVRGTVAYERNNEVLFDIDWSEATWGAGAQFTLTNVLAGHELAEIRLKAKTTAGSGPGIFAGLATADDANVEYRREHANTVTQGWQEFVFPVSRFTKSKPDVDSRDFTDDDWNQIKIVKILFSKPESPDQNFDTIQISDPVLAFRDPSGESITKLQISSQDSDFQSLTAGYRDDTDGPTEDDAFINLGEIEYDNTMDAVEIGKERGLVPREISNIYLGGAGKCRDEGSGEYAVALFEAAIETDPTNGYAYRIYGDYLAGYRGLFEQAAAKYYRAVELVEADPEAYDDDFVLVLNRSLKILHRDRKDGIPIYNNYATNGFSLFYEQSIEFRKPSIDEDDHLTFLDLQQRSLNTGLPSINEGITFFTARRDNALTQADFDTAQERIDSLQGQKSRLLDFAKHAPRRREEAIYEGKLLLRFNNEELPYFRLTWTEVDIDTINFNTEDPRETFDGEFRGLSLLVGKNYYINGRTDLNLEATLSNREVTSRDRRRDFDVTTEEFKTIDINAVLTQYFGTNTLKLTAGNMSGEVDRTEVGNVLFDDRVNQQRISLRLSMFKKPIETENPTRFRGRRSDHYEIGLQRRERAFKTETIRFDYKPNLTAEFLGLRGGHLDILFNYNSQYRRFLSSFRDGNYDAHEFLVKPTWVFVYDLYNNSFTEGTEFLALGFPLRVILGDKDGDYTRVTAGMELEQQWVSKIGIRFEPKVGFEYTRYPDISKSDWGIFAKGTLRF